MDYQCRDSRAVQRLGRRLAREARTAFLWSRRYAQLREPKLRGGIEVTAQDEQRIVADLRAGGVDVRELPVDAAACRAWVANARYDTYREYQRGGTAPSFAEKSLEHWLASQLLHLAPGEVYIDVANDSSPVPEIYSRIHGCVSYRQDLRFAPGLHGNVIGSDAGQMPVPDCFADAMALHCSFEHFEADADSRFVREAGRVLKPGGRVCIVPLYMSARYSILTDPSVLAPRAGFFEPDALLCCVRRYGNRHGRHYDVPHLLRRVAGNRGELRLTVYWIRGAQAVSRSCYVRFAAVLDKPPLRAPG